MNIFVRFVDMYANPGENYRRMFLVLRVQGSWLEG